ncbi:GtrA family protein [Donghicola tyrosinivorans]|uniref:Putative flippase GtrA n=1 Tax=Donghicola tyrosinivorans TaxID=1652492 RepID=A0A2T0WWC7_9RHOB|nr:GtrA family protein [Donghicola tyrosinivorans]PRY90991.1 putative flippase GtrA [Donghicola tyrosinivorans]
MDIGQTLRFIIAGSFTAGIYFLLMLGFLNLGFPNMLAALAAHAIAFCIGYLSQKRFAFRSETGHSRSLPRYAALQACCAGSAVLSAWLCARLAISTPTVVAAITTLVLSAVSYITSARWVFRD